MPTATAVLKTAQAEQQSPQPFRAPTFGLASTPCSGRRRHRCSDPGVEISFWDSQRGSLCVSRIEGDRVKCNLRASPNIGEALNPLGRFLNGRIEPRAQALFALAHEVGQAA